MILPAVEVLNFVPSSTDAPSPLSGCEGEAVDGKITHGQICGPMVRLTDCVAPMSALSSSERTWIVALPIVVGVQA